MKDQGNLEEYQNGRRTPRGFVGRNS